MEFLAHKADHIHQFPCLIRIHSRSRFIQKQKLRLRRQRSCNLQASLLTVRKIRRFSVSSFFQIKHFQQLHGLLIHFFLHFPVSRETQDSLDSGIMMLIVKPHFYIIQNTQIFKETDILECSCDACFTDIDGLFPCDIFPVQDHLSCIRSVNSCQQVKDSCLTRSVGTDQPVKFFFFD